MDYSIDDVIILNESELREYQMHILEMTKEVVAFFDNNGIGYSLSGGSILGAIRHKGFIPWDDDVDLNMPRNDYDRMVELFESQLGDRYYLQTPFKNPELGLMVTQIRKKGTVARRKYDWNSAECGLSIDIYIIENLYDNGFKRKIQELFSMALSFAISSIRYCNNKDLPKEIQMLEGRKMKYTKSKIIFGKILKIIPLKTWIRWCDYWYSKCKDTDSKLVVIPSGRKHFSNEIYKREDMCLFRKTEFETEYFNVPINAESYLTQFYGDYMKIPPKEQREQHVFLELKY